MRTLMKIILLILTATSLIACSNHTINKTHELSRDNTTIEFSSSKKPYSVQEEVGGEQINTTTIKAHANETYLIEVSSNNDSLNLYIDSDSISVQVLNNKPIKRKITTQAKTDIEFSFTSHPDASMYELRIYKL